MKSAGLRAGTYAVRLRGTLWPFIVTLLSALNGYLQGTSMSEKTAAKSTGL